MKLSDHSLNKRGNVPFAALAISLNAFLAFILAANLKPIKFLDHKEVFATIYEDRLAQSQLQTPVPNAASMEVEPAPEIQIQDEHLAEAVSVHLSSQILAPRPDPTHYNEMPETPYECASTGTPSALILKIFVSKDGAISDASILKSSGVSCLDIAALAFVRGHWRFLPALANGIALDDWTSVGVTFRPAG